MTDVLPVSPVLVGGFPLIFDIDNKMKINLLGDSFVARVLVKIQSSEHEYFEANFGLSDVQVHWVCRGGGVTFVGLRQDINRVPLPEAEVVFVQGDSNGLCKKSVGEVLRDLDLLMFDVVRDAVRRGRTPPFVVVGAVKHRRPGSFTSWGKHKINITEYNARVDAFNAGVFQKAMNFPKLMGFWEHKHVDRLGEAPGALHPSDGVHLGPKGDEKFYASLRVATMHAISYLNGRIPVF